MNLPQKRESPVAAGPSAEQTKSDSAILPDPDCGRKAFATLAARLALNGYSLHELSCGGYLIARWVKTAHFSDLLGVREFLARVTGGAA